MDIITLITILSGIAGVIGLIYVLVIGQRSIPEWFRERRRKRTDQESKRITTPETTGQVIKTKKDLLPYKQYVGLARGFWGFSETSYIDIVCSEIPEEERPYFADPRDRNYLRYAKFADLDSLMYVRTKIAQVYPELHIRDFSPSEYFDTHTKGLIIVGGPAWNSKFREFQWQLPFYFISKPVGEDEELIIDNIPDCVFLPTWDENKELIKDISIFVRVYVEKEVPVFLIGGCLTFGVLGASKCFFDRSIGPSNIEYMENLVGVNDFISVFETYRVGGFVVTADLSAREPLIVLKRSRGAHKFEAVVENVDNYRSKK